MDEAEARARLRLIQIQKEKAAAAPVAAEPAPAPAPEVVAEPPGLFARSRARLQQGVSDAFSTAVGDTYGISGDPTENNAMGTPRKLLKIVGGNIIPAVGEVVADAAIAGGKAVLPQSAEDAIASGVQTVASSAPVQAIGRGLDATREAFPVAYDVAGDALNVATAFIPVKKIPLTGFGGEARLAKSTAAAKARETLRMLEPADKNVFKSGTNTIKKGLLGQKEFVPNQKYQEMIDEVAAIPEVNPRRSYTRNKEVILQEVNKTEAALRQKLAGEPPLSKSTVDNALTDARNNYIGGSNALGGGGTKTIDKFHTLADTMVNDRLAGRQLVGGKIVGEITPNDLLDVRIKFDQAARTKFPKVFEKKGTQAAAAVEEVRNSLNKALAQHTPGAGVPEDLTRMHRLLKANEIVAPRSVSEGGNRLMRGIADLERSTGLKHPGNPISASRTVTDVPAAILVGSAAMLGGGTRALGEGLARNSVATQRLLAAALRNAPEGVAKSVIIDTINSNKEKDSRYGTR